MENERSGSSSSSSGSGSESGSESGGGSTSGSGSGSSSGNSSEAEEERLEPVSVMGRSLSLPQRLCESKAIFDEVLSARSWDSLEEADRERLRLLLPTFAEDDADEKDRTVQALFARESFHFSSPLETFHTNLKHGNFRPDIAKMKRYLIKARQRQQKHKMRSYYASLLPEVLIARERLLTAARSSPPGPPPRLPPLPPLRPRRQYKPAHARAKLRYFEELAAIRSEVGEEHISDDENYPDGPPQQSRRQRRHMNAMQNAANVGVASTLGGVESSRPSSLDCLKHVLAAHRTRRQRRENHPELNTAGVTLEDIKQRVALVNGTKKTSFAAAKAESQPNKLKRPSKKESSKTKVQPDVKPIYKAPLKEFDFSEINEFKNNVTIKSERMDTDSDNSSYIDPVESPKSNKRLKISPAKPEIKQEHDVVPMNKGNIFTIKMEPKIKQETVDTISFSSQNITQPIPIKLEDLEGIDMMDLPVELADCDVTEAIKTTPSPRLEPTHADTALMETTHANFLSLVRALFPARTAHRASRQELHSRAAALMSSPIAPLNTWYSLSDDWCSELDSALEFLAGEKGPHPDDFVPYLTYIPESQMYQWIGAGRDCDAILGRLCERWLRSRAGSPPSPTPPSPRPPSREIPTSRNPTTWGVRPPTAAELADFHHQERKRYATAARPFTYVQHGYRSVVGPAGRGPANRASHASLLTPDRPRHVSFISLVKDAVARLPGGEGTKAQIITLLKMSQYLSPVNDATLSHAVGGALDRLQAVKREPFLRLERRTDTWIHAHRHKTEEDWERTARSRGGKSSSKTTKEAADSIANVAPPPPPPLPAAASPCTIEMEVCKLEQTGSGSDSDVDVDDSGPSTALCPPVVTSQPRLPVHQVRSLTPQQKLLQQIRPPPRMQPQKQYVQKHQQLLQQKQLLQQTQQKPTKPEPQSPKQQQKPQAVKPQPKTTVVKQVISSPTPVSQHPTSATMVQSSAVPQTVPVSKPISTSATVLPPKSSPMIQVSLPQKSPVSKQRLLLQSTAETTSSSMPIQMTSPVPCLSGPVVAQSTTVVSTAPTIVVSSTTQPLVQTSVQQQAHTKMSQATRSLLLKASTGATSIVSGGPSVLSPTLVANAQVNVGGRRGVVRVLSPATPTSGKSLISPRALMPQGNAVAAKRRTPVTQTSVPTTTSAQLSTVTMTTATTASPAPVVSTGTRTVQLAGGRTVQLSTNQTLHLPSGQTVQAVQLSTGHTLQLSSLGVGARIPISQTVSSAQVLRPSTVVRPAVSLSGAKQGTIQLSGQNVQMGIPGQMQIGQSVRLSTGQSVQLTGQTVQLPSGQSVQLGGQTVQLASGQTVQLASGQTIQLANGQTVQLGANVGSTRSLVATQQPRPTTADKAQQPLVAKLLTNSQGQVISVEGVVGAGRTIQLANVRPQAAKQLHTVQGVGGVRVVGVGSGGRVTRPLLLTHKPLHNVILQQGDSGALRAISAAGATTNQTIVLSNTAGQASGSAPTSTAPVLKLQQVSPMQQLKLTQGIKLQQAGGVRGVVMSPQLKLVNAGRHVLARVLRPAPPQ